MSVSRLPDAALQRTYLKLYSKTNRRGGHQCESGGDPTAIGGGGLYRGKYQFSVDTWRAVGGTGDPAAAPEADQDRRAAMLLARSGAGQWPV